MKKVYTYVLAAIATIAVVASCAKEQESKLEEGKEGKEVEKVEGPAEFNYTFGIGAESPNTKSEFSVADKYVSWVEGDDFLGAYAIKNETTSYNQKCDVKTDPSLSFVLKSYCALESGDAIYAYYPYDYINSNTTDYHNPNNVHLSIASAQAQEGDTFDSSAMPMVAKYVLAEDLEANTGKSVGTMSFVNLAGILDFKVYSSNATYRTESVKAITFKANSAICGEFNYNLSGLDYETASSMEISGYEGTTITTSVTNATALTAEKGTAYDICMAVAPGSYTGVVEVVTDKAIYTYNVTSAKTVGRSQILSLGVNLGTGSRKSINPADYNWALVKDINEIGSGEWVLIAASGSAVAMSTTQNNNNRPEIAITKAGDALTAVETVQIFEIETGSVASSYAFKAVNGATRGQYIYAQSSSSNNMRSQSTIDDNASWAISVTEVGVATIIAQGTNTHNKLKYNSNSKMFSAYESGQSAVAIYILDDPSAVKIRPNTNTVNFLATDGSGDDKTVDFYLKNVDSWDVDNSNTTDFTVADEITGTPKVGHVNIAPNAVNNTYSAKLATVTVSTIGADDVVISVSQAAKAAVCTPSTATTDIPATVSDYYTITVNSNVPWTAAVTNGAGYVEDFEVSGNTTSAPATTDGTVTIEFKNNTGSVRTIEFTITPNEVGCGLSSQTITFTQSGSVSTPLSNPTGISIARINGNSFDASWTNDTNASSYNWVLSEEDDYENVAPANTVASGTSSDAVLNEGTWYLYKTGITPTLSTSKTYYLFVQAVGSGSYTSSQYGRIATGQTPLNTATLDYTGDGVNSETFSYSSGTTVNGWYIQANKNSGMQTNTEKSGNSSGSHIKSPTLSANPKWVRVTVASGAGTPKINNTNNTTNAVTYSRVADSVYSFDLTSKSWNPIYVVSTGAVVVTHIEIDY